MAYEDPVTWEEWRTVATERKADAAHLRSGSRFLAASYFYGFAIECTCKALRSVEGMKNVREHDLVKLLESVNVTRLDLGIGAHCADTRDVSLRYQSQLPPGYNQNKEFESIDALLAWCEKRLQRRVEVIQERSNLSNGI